MPWPFSIKAPPRSLVESSSPSEIQPQKQQQQQQQRQQRQEDEVPLLHRRRGPGGPVLSRQRGQSSEPVLGIPQRDAGAVYVQYSELDCLLWRNRTSFSSPATELRMGWPAGGRKQHDRGEQRRIENQRLSFQARDLLCRAPTPA